MNYRYVIGIVAGLVIIVGAAIYFIVSLKPLWNVCPREIRQCRGKDLLFVRLPDGEGDCYRAGEEPQDICKENMAIRPNFNCRKEGVCDCDYERHRRHLIYHNETEACYFIYTQAFCPPDQVLSVTPDQTPVCIADVCRDQKLANPDEEHLWVPFGASGCAKLYSQPHPNCTEDLQFYKHIKKPSCFDKTELVANFSAVQYNDPEASVVGDKIGSMGAIGASRCSGLTMKAPNGQCAPLILPSDDDDMFT